MRAPFLLRNVAIACEVWSLDDLSKGKRGNSNGMDDIAT